MIHQTLVRPLFGDVDAMNVVYYGNYLRYFERGRCELMREEGLPYSELEAMGLHLPVTEAHVRYKSPARYDDLLMIETRLAWLKRASLRFEYAISKQDSENEKQLLVEGYTVHGCVSHEGKISRIPDKALRVLRRVL